MIFVKSVVGGLIGVLAAWAVIVALYAARLAQIARQHGESGLVAVAGGWDYLLRKPSTALLLATAFGIAFHLTARLAGRA
jgi:hypothetical protein